MGRLATTGRDLHLRTTRGIAELPKGERDTYHSTAATRQRTMAKQVRPAGGQADNKRGLRGCASDWLRLRAFHHGPARTRSNGEAEDTTAVSILTAIVSGAPATPTATNRTLRELDDYGVNTTTDCHAATAASRPSRLRRCASRSLDPAYAPWPQAPMRRRPSLRRRRRRRHGERLMS